MTTGLLVVDVQPAYDPYCSSIARDVAKRINNTRKPTLVMWVGEGITSDTEEEVREYLRAHGARPGCLDRCAFIEKDYGFFRAWMDNGVHQDTILTVGKVMLSTARCFESGDLDLVELLGEEGSGGLPCDSLRLPSFDDRKLRCFDTFETCGGGDRECLAEMELWLSMVGKEFKRLDHLVYG